MCTLWSQAPQLIEVSAQCPHSGVHPQLQLPSKSLTPLWNCTPRFGTPHLGASMWGTYQPAALHGPKVPTWYRSRRAYLGSALPALRSGIAEHRQCHLSHLSLPLRDALSQFASITCEACPVLQTWRDKREGAGDEEDEEDKEGRRPSPIVGRCSG